MSFIDRKNSISYISPSGVEFTPISREFTENINHSAPSFESPDINGGIHQDLGLGISSFPLTFEFKGLEHDEEAKSFMLALREIGPGKLIEPYSRIERIVQPISISKTVNLVKDVSRTVFTVTFEEDNKNELTFTSDNLNDLVENSIDNSNISLQDSFEDQLNLDSVTDQISIVNTASDFLQNMSDTIGSSTAALENNIDQILTEPAEFMLALQELLQAPQIASDRVINKIKGYKDLMERSFNNTLSIYDPDNYLLTENQLANNLIFAQSSGGSIMTATENELKRADYLTKSELVEAQQEALELYEYYRDFLDEIQNSGYSTYGSSFWSQRGEIQEIIQNMIALSNALLFDIAFSLRIEYVFTVDDPITLYNIAYEYYKEELTNDENAVFEFIEQTNKLKGDEIILIPADREMKVYI